MNKYDLELISLVKSINIIWKKLATIEYDYKMHSYFGEHDGFFYTPYSYEKYREEKRKCKKELDRLIKIMNKQKDWRKNESNISS